MEEEEDRIAEPPANASTQSSPIPAQPFLTHGVRRAWPFNFAGCV